MANRVVTCHGCKERIIWSQVADAWIDVRGGTSVCADGGRHTIEVSK